MEKEEESPIDLSSLTVDEDDADGTSTEEDSEDEETSREEYDYGDEDGPPIHFDEDPASPPEWILLDVHSYIDARTNATTAYACRPTGGHGAIRVTFWPARPPRVSCFTVHCNGVYPRQFHGDPKVLAADEDLVLLEAAIKVSESPFSAPSIEYYVYQAAGATPTLRLLTVPCRGLSDAGILRLRGGDNDGEFLVATIKSVADTDGGQYALHLFDSRTWTWTTRLMRLDTPERFARAGFHTTKVLTVGGECGSMAWVDLRQGMLICDLLTLADDNDNDGGAKLRYMQLPPSPSTDQRGCPSDFRDIAVVQGRIKFFEMRHKVRRRAITSTATLVTRYWKATAWEKTDPWQSWHRDCRLDLFKVPVDRTHPELPSRLHDMGKLHGCKPALSLHEDVVYVMARARAKLYDRRAWMLAVDVRKKTLREVAASHAQMRYDSTYLQSRMSSYLRIQPSTR